MAAVLSPFVMVEIILPELFEESHQLVSAPFSLVSNLFLAKQAMAIDYYGYTWETQLVALGKCR